MKSLKIKCFTCLLVIFFVLIVLYFFGRSSFSTFNPASNFEYNDDFVIGISSNNNNGAFDSGTGTYYFSKNLFDVNNLKIRSPYKVKYEATKQDDYTYIVDIHSKNYYQQRIIKVVDSNIISISDNYDINEHANIGVSKISLDSKDYSKIFFELMDNNYVNHNTYPTAQYYNGRIRTRGATSFILPKKSYKIELDEKVSLFGMNRDDDWILDSLYTDKSKIRNKFASDLWNRINDNQLINNDLNGEFVEVFINNEYMGLYVLKEKISMKNVDLTDNGVLVKSVAHVDSNVKNNIISNNINIFNDGSDLFYENFEIKNYTNNSLNKFFSRLRDYYSDYSYDSIYNNFDIDNFLNYNLFVIFMSGSDNVSKNQYLSMADDKSKILITPWDMDLSFGTYFCDQSGINSCDSFENFSDISWLYTEFFNNYDYKTKVLMKERYFELRKDVINMDMINTYLDSYKMLLLNSGSSTRDSEKWYDYDINNQIDYIRLWSSKRIEFLDEFFYNL